MYKIKQLHEDFIVEEVPKLKLDQGNYAYFLLEKKGWETRKAINEISRRLNISEKRINIAGIKDKSAITRQYISIFKINKPTVERLRIKDIKLKFVGYGKERIKLGQLEANKFTIVVRNLDKKSEKIKFLENYYDEQRFGGRNHLLGKALVKHEFRKACFMLRLKWDQGDYITPLRRLGNRLLRFYINSFQSLIFNKVLAEYIKINCKKYFERDYSFGYLVFTNENIKNKKIPIVGFLTEFKDRKIKSIYERVLKEEGIKKEDFLIRQIPEISSEGNTRDAIIKIKDLNIKYEADELHKGRKKAILTFILPPGCYGTMVIKKMFG